MEYELIRSSRRTIAIQIKADGRLIVRCPYHMPEERVRRFVLEKQDWIRKHLPGKVAEPKFTSEQLQELPGIGPALAGRILEYREKNGPFRSPWELTAVSGLGEAKVSDLLPYVTVSEKEK